MLTLSVPFSSPAQPVTVNAVGDIMLSGSRSAVFKQKGFDFPFAATTRILREADITVGNLENPVARGGAEFRGKKFRFRADPAMVPALSRAGFTLLTLANNHILDYGSTALQETFEHLERSGIGFVGAGNNLDAARREKVITVKGKRIAFLAYSLTQPEEFYATDSRPGTAPGYAAHYLADIARARTAADHVIVSFHWGGEGVETLRPYQKSVAHRAIDAGANVVLGHHPHLLQGIERYRNGLILYSLGNFAFASMSRTSATSMIARITLDESRIDLEIFPLNVLNSQVAFQPKLLSGGAGKRVMDRLNRLSGNMGGRLEVVDGRFLLSDAAASHAFSD